MFDTRKKKTFREYALTFNLETTIVILVTLSIYTCVKYDSGNYILETPSKLRFRINNQKKSIRDNSMGFPMAGHFNQPDDWLEDLKCFIVRGVFKTTADRLIYAQTSMSMSTTHQILHWFSTPRLRCVWIITDA